MRFDAVDIKKKSQKTWVHFIMLQSFKQDVYRFTMMFFVKNNQTVLRLRLCRVPFKY